MKQTRARKRKTTLIGLSALAAALFALSALNLSSDANYNSSPRTGHFVFPRLNQTIETAKIIRVRLGDSAYTLKRAQAGSNDWVMIESGNYPVRPDRLSALAEGLIGLEWGAKRTTDPTKLKLLGLGDPANGGNGAYLEVVSQDDSILSALITGRREDRLYARRPDETNAFRVIGNLPPLYTREAWLDLNIVDMAPDVIGAVRITDVRGDSLYLTRAPGTGSRAFRPAPPFESDQLISRLATSGPALALSRLAPIDVKPSAALETARIARHITSTHDGLEVDISAYREPDGFYITLRAVEAGEGARRAETINMKAEGWAFRLTEFDWNELTPPVSSIVRR